MIAKLPANRRNSRLRHTTRLRSIEVDAYIAAREPSIRAVLEKIRDTVHRAAPNADEVISYRMPAFLLEGRILVYFAAFKKHIGLYPPVRGDAVLARATARYAGPKGNLQFPYAEAIPYALIAQIVRSRAAALESASA